MNSGSPGCRRERVRSSRPPTRERGSGRHDDTDRDGSGGRAVPAGPRRARRVAAHPPGVPDGRRGLPRLARRQGRGLAPARRGRTCGPISPSSLRATLAHPLRSDWRRSARSIAGRPARAWPRATRGARSPRPGSHAGSPRSSRSSRSTGSWRSSTRTSTPHPADDPGPHRRPPRARTARPGARRDGLRGGPADQRARLRGSVIARSPARRDQGHGQGPQRADRPSRQSRRGTPWRRT